MKHQGTSRPQLHASQATVASTMPQVNENSGSEPEIKMDINLDLNITEDPLRHILDHDDSSPSIVTTVTAELPVVPIKIEFNDTSSTAEVNKESPEMRSTVPVLSSLNNDDSEPLTKKRNINRRSNHNVSNLTYTSRITSDNSSKRPDISDNLDYQRNVSTTAPAHRSRPRPPRDKETGVPINLGPKEASSNHLTLENDMMRTESLICVPDIPTIGAPGRIEVRDLQEGVLYKQNSSSEMSSKKSRRSKFEILDSGSEAEEDAADCEDDVPVQSASELRMLSRWYREYAIYEAEGYLGAAAEMVEMVDDATVGADIEVGDELSVEHQEVRQDEVPICPSPTLSPATAVDEIGTGEVFDWTSDFETFTGQEEKYIRKPGPQGVTSFVPMDIFLQFWDLPIVAKIAEETNRYARQTIAKLPDKIPKYLESWEDTTVEELYRLFALQIYMASCYRARLSEYWTTGTLGMPDFRRIMSRNRYQLLMRFMHFMDNVELVPTIHSYDKKIQKVMPLLAYMNEKFSSLYIPKRALNLDESILLSKDRLNLAQCVRTKAACPGIKAFELCEAQSGYLLKCVLYAEKESPSGSLPKFGDITAKVLELMNGYLDVGHLLVMGNWYNQLPLTRYLKRRKTDVLGLMKQRRANVPDAIKFTNDSKMVTGQQIAFHCGDIAMVAWKDVVVVCAISTFHNDEQVACRRGDQVVMKPKMLQCYNNCNTGGFYLKDRKLGVFERKRDKKWYRTFFKTILNTSLLNGYIIHSKQPTLGKISHQDFRKRVADGLLKMFPKSIASRPQMAINNADLVRLDGASDHFPVHTATKPNSNWSSRRRCARCSQRGFRNQVTTMCGRCEVPLCLGKCYRDYHTLQNLKTDS